MGVLDDLASRNTTRLELTASMASVGTSTYTATATSDSSNGAVDVVLSDTVTGDGIDDSVSVELPTTVSVRKGDTVLVTGYGGEVIKSAVVTGDLGGGDRIRDEVDGIVSATSQYFWTVDGEDGAHVTNIPQEQFLEDPSGANLLANSNGILLRDGETYLSAFTPSGMAVYDGNGNGAGNVVAEFTANGARIGYEDSANVAISSNGVMFSDSNGYSVGRIASGDVLDVSAIVKSLSTERQIDLDAGESATFGFTGTPDFSSGPITVVVRSDSISQSGTLQAHGTAIDNERMTVVTSATSGGWQVTVTAKVSLAINSNPRTPTFASYVSYYISALAPIYELGGTATAPYALAANRLTVAGGKYQTALGRFNAEDANDAYALIIGNGTSDSNRSNAFTIDWQGNIGCGHVEQDRAVGNITLSNIGSGAKTLYLEREGSIVHASMTATATAGTANSAITCGTIPTGYRPTHNEFQSGTCVTNNTLSGYYRWRIATGGTVTYWCSVTGIRESPLCMTWVTDDAW